ncbi:putative RNA-binding protein 19 isoform X2, partial [Apostichopus japonicus]
MHQENKYSVHPGQRSLDCYYGQLFILCPSRRILRMPLASLNTNGRRKGKLYAEFFSEEDVSQALTKHKQYMGKRYLQVIRDVPSQPRKEASSTSEKSNQADNLAEKGQAEGLLNNDELVAETGRLFVRNLAYVCKETDLEQLFSTYGPLTEVNLPIDKFTKKSKGFAFVTFMMPEHAVKAYTELDGKDFMGRLMHLLPGKEKITKETEENEGSSFKNQKAAKQKAQSGSSHNWNTLFIGSNAVAEALASKYNTTKQAVLDPDAKGSLGVRMALGETQIVAETRQFLVDNGVALDSFSQASAPRSKTVMIAKNLPAGTKPDELGELFTPHGQLGKVLLPPAGVTAIIEMLEPSEARVAFYNLAYTKFHHVPLYLEWAPMDVFAGDGAVDTDTRRDKGETEGADDIGGDEDQAIGINEENKGARKPEEQRIEIGDEEEDEEKAEEEEETEPESTLFVKNINFDTFEETLQNVFSKCGKVKSVVISRKRDPYKSDELLSMGFGFVEFFKRGHAMRALKELQHILVDEHQLELKVSNRTTLQKTQRSGRKSISQKQPSSKIMVRNIPFEAQVREIRDLFSTFGEIKYVRLTKKMSGTGSHRGFGFVEFLTKQDAKRAFDALCHSSHCSAA